MKCGPPFWLWSGFMVSRWMLKWSGSFWLWRLRHGFVVKMVTTVMITSAGLLIFSSVCSFPIVSLLLFVCFSFQQHVWRSVWKLQIFCWVATCRKTSWASELFSKPSSSSGLMHCTRNTVLQPWFFFSFLLNVQLFFFLLCMSVLNFCLFWFDLCIKTAL